MKNITFMLALDSGLAINKNVVVPNTWTSSHFLGTLVLRQPPTTNAGEDLSLIHI